MSVLADTVAAGGAAAADDDRTPRARVCLRVRGAVQGVGFRPFVYRVATGLGLAGWVANTPEGVIVEAEGPEDRLLALAETLRREAPAPASVTGIAADAMPLRGGDGFAIRDSKLSGGRAAQVLPDLAVCDDCLREVTDPADRRYRYPFVNCTRCGPRYSIVEDVPYDRSRTAMRSFAMCDRCRAEYADPGNRRFHAEPNACPDCGPQLALWDRDGTVLAERDGALLAAVRAIREGRIVAVKGLGGFHLVVDARDEAAVRTLRDRKRRPAKPFAVMYPTLADVRAACEVDAAEEALLTGPAHPVVLLRRRADVPAAAVSSSVAPSVAPGLSRLGVLLPYTPLHHLLMQELGFPVVATSGNLSEEPIVTDEAEALARLAGIADLFLVHDRPIVRPVDDSVAQVVCGRPQILRRARGYAPAPVGGCGLPPGILAVGGHLKTAAALTTAAGLVAGPHVGDLDTAAARAAHASAVGDIARLHDTPPAVAVCDLHPDYASARAAEAAGVPVRRVQHHVAHVAACMAEHELAPPVLGVAWDGSGYGPDGTVWGGEFLLVTAGGWRRVGHLRAFPLPGGEAAVREPRRAALGLLHEACGEAAFGMTDLAPVADFSTAERTVLENMLARGINTPRTTSAGRLFDGIAALCGLRQRAGYEGEAAALLEDAAHGVDAGRKYDFALDERDDGTIVVDWAPALAAVLGDLRSRAPAGDVSAALHAGLGAAIAAVVRRVGVPTVALTGGCFQNRLLTEAAVADLDACGFAPFFHRAVPPNDGGLAVGQAAWVAWHPDGGHPAGGGQGEDG